jgi:3-phenylpropionate/trans-cinnamate dioxygenase ferredoxin subunit
MKFTLDKPLKPGEITCISLQGTRILLANVAGTYHASSATCTHEDWPLCNGALKQDSIECPLHGSRFNLLTGAPLDEPASEALRIYPLRRNGDEFEIDLG